MKRRTLTLLIMILLLSTCQVVRAQPADQLYFDRPTTAPTIMRSWDYHVQLRDESPFNNIKWRNVGPTRQGGRVSSIDCPAGSDSTIYVSVGTAGVWKTQNNGRTWQELFTDEATFTVGDLAIAPSNSDIIWVGSGEGAPPRSGYAGCGVFKSINGGKSWKNMGLHDTQHIGRIVIDPKNPDVVYVAALGHVYTENQQRGLYKTTNGGNTWKKVLYVDNVTGVIDLVMDPDDSQTLYAAAWQQIRHAWDYQSAGPGSGTYKSTDGGETWSELTEGLPQGDGVGRIGLAVAPGNPQVVYAAYLDVKADSGEPGVYRSDDKGQTWSKVNENRMSSGIWYYFGDIRVSPDNEDQVYVLTQSLQRSDDGGKTFKGIGRGTHADHHALWIDPDNPDRVLDGNDGGFYISQDRGETFEHINNMPIGEFYAISVDMAKPYNIYGGLQDNGCSMGPSTHVPTWDGQDAWRRTGGGDGFVTFPDPSDNSIIYTESQFGAFRRTGGQGRATRPEPQNRQLRRNWMTPYIISTHNPSVLYFGAYKLFKSMNKGNDWTCISDDLTKFRPERQGNVPHATLTTISESPIRRGLLYVGTDDGNVWVTRDDGENWKLINEDLPDLWVSRVIASQYDLETVYVTLTGYREDNFKPYVFKSTDFGETWKSIESNLPIEAVNVIREDPNKKNVLYVGTELGVYTSLDGGGIWVSLCSGLPTTPVHDLVIHPRERDLIIGTHGRSIWILDDLELVQNFDVENLQKIERPDLFSEPEEEADLPQQQQDVVNLTQRQQERARKFWEREDVRKFFEKQDLQTLMVTENLLILWEAGDIDALMEKLELLVQQDKQQQQKQVIIVEQEQVQRRQVRRIREVNPPPTKAETQAKAAARLAQVVKQAEVTKQAEADKQVIVMKKAPVVAGENKVREIREVYPPPAKKVRREETIEPDKVKKAEVKKQQVKVKKREIREIRHIHHILGEEAKIVPYVVREIREIGKVVIRVENTAPSEKPRKQIRRISEVRPAVRLAEPKSFGPGDLAGQDRQIRENRTPGGQSDISQMICENRGPAPKREICETRLDDKVRPTPEIRENRDCKKTKH